MSRLNKFLYIFVCSAMLIVSISMLVVPIPPDLQNVPEIINGLTSSVSIIVGFTATVFVIMLMRQELKLSEFQFVLVLFFLMLSVTLMVFAYTSLIIHNKPQDALRFAMINLFLSFSTFITLLFFLYTKIYKHE